MMARKIVKPYDEDKITDKTKYLSVGLISAIENFCMGFILVSYFFFAGYLGTFVFIQLVFCLSVLVMLFTIIFNSYFFMELKLKHMGIKKKVLQVKFDKAEVELVKKHTRERMESQNNQNESPSAV